jgi:hypothetical protein
LSLASREQASPTKALCLTGRHSGFQGFTGTMVGNFQDLAQRMLPDCDDIIGEAVTPDEEQQKR